MDISFIIPHKNEPDLLVRCINSIPQFKNMEIIVIDDDSENLDWSNVESRANKKFKLIKNHDRLGAGHARNIGLNICKGKWVVFADADDFFSEEAGQILSCYINSDYDIIYLNANSVNSDDITKSSFRTKGRSALIAEYLKEPNLKKEREIRIRFVEPWSKIFRGSFIRHYDFRFSETYVCNDLFFSVQTGCTAKLIKVDNRVFYYNTFRLDSLSMGTFKNLEKAICRLSESAKSQSYIEHNYGTIEFNVLGGAFSAFVQSFPLHFFTAFKIVSGYRINKSKLLKSLWTQRRKLR